MAFSIDKLKKDQLLVKELKACEEMGSITEICTGKTATLTENILNVQVLYTGDQHIQIVKESYPNSFTAAGLNPKVVQLIKESIVYNCDAIIEMSDDAKYVPRGNGIEVGMLMFLQSNDVPI